MKIITRQKHAGIGSVEKYDRARALSIFTSVHNEADSTLVERDLSLYYSISTLYNPRFATRVIDHNVEHGGKHEEKKVMETLQGIVMTNAVQHDVNRDLQQITKGCDLYPPPLISDG